MNRHIVILPDPDKLRARLLAHPRTQSLRAQAASLGLTACCPKCGSWTDIIRLCDAGACEGCSPHAGVKCISCRVKIGPEDDARSTYCGSIHTEEFERHAKRCGACRADLD